MLDELSIKKEYDKYFKFVINYDYKNNSITKKYTDVLKSFQRLTVLHYVLYGDYLKDKLDVFIEKNKV